MSNTSSETEIKQPLECLKYAYGTDVGRRREENQDSLGVVETRAMRFYLVADGMGGVKGGAIASNLAVSTIKEVLSVKEQLTEAEICEAVGEANARIFERGMEEPTLAGMGTTFVGIGFTDASMYVASVGDSRAYRIRQGIIEQLTEDHTLVMELLRSGAISEEQAGNHPVSHMLTRSLGPAPSVEIDCWKVPDGPAAGDLYLLCSDGLYNLVGAEEFLEIFESSTLDEAVQEFIDLANLRGGTDNITVLLVQVGEEYPVSPAQFVAEDEPVEEATADEVETDPSDAVTDDGSGVMVGVTPEEAAAGAAQSASVDTTISGSVSLEDLQARMNPEEEEPVLEEIVEEEETAQESDAMVPPRDAERFSGLSLRQFLFVCGLCFIAFLGGVFWQPDIFGSGAQPVPVTKGIDGGTQHHAAAPVEPKQHAAQHSLPPHSAVHDLTIPVAEPVHSGPTGGVTGDGYHGLTQEEVLRIVKRKETLRENLKLLQEKIDSFDKPLSARTAALLSTTEQRTEELTSELEKVRDEIDIATRRLAVWYGRRKRLGTVDPLNLASDVAVTSNAVREKKEAFEHATWSYLREAEQLRYNPNDQAQQQKVADLVTQRKERMRELGDEVRRAIDKEVSDADRKISELTLKRDTVEGDLSALKNDRDYVEVLTRGNAETKAKKQADLKRQYDLVAAELEELSHLLPDAAEKSVAR